MNAQGLRPPPHRGSLLTLTVSLLFFVVLAFGFAPGVAHSQRDETPPHERNFENHVPAHVPIKVKVKNPDRAKDLKNEDWLGELEVEVKNTGDKPVYFLYLLLDMPDVKDEAGIPYAVQLHYGRKQLVRMDAPLETGDVPILPGESVTLKVPAGRASAYREVWRKKGNVNPRKVNIELQFLNFGDGTGMDTTQGAPVSAPRKERSANSPPPRDGAGG